MFKSKSLRIQPPNALNSAFIHPVFSMNMKRSYSKSELAVLADVSYSTFYRYLKTRRKVLSKLGSTPKAKTLRGKALDYVCTDYGITLPDDPPEPVRKHSKFV